MNDISIFDFSSYKCLKLLAAKKTLCIEIILAELNIRVSEFNMIINHRAFKIPIS